jgi:hypothetical protein
MGGVGGLVRITQATEKPKGRIRRRLVVKESTWNSKSGGLTRPAIKKVCSSRKGLGPVGGRHVHLEEKGVCDVVDCVYSTLSFAVLWGGVGAGHERMDFVSCKKLE